MEVNRSRRPTGAQAGTVATTTDRCMSSDAEEAGAAAYLLLLLLSWAYIIHYWLDMLYVRNVQVKLQYRKAMLVVHPDHCVTLSNENKFLSKRIFEAVNEAYNEFLKKESVWCVYDVDVMSIFREKNMC